MIIKKLTLLICLILITSCSNDEIIDSSSTFNPPQWIQGTWGRNETDLQLKQALYKFNSNDFIIVSLIMELSQKDLIEQNKKVGTNSIVTEEITNSVYNVSIKTGALTTTYKFKKIDATHISTELAGFTAVLDKL